MALGRRSKSLNQRAKSRNKVGTSIESLPKEVMTTVLALVASKSLTDLINAKLSCKYLLQISDDDFIFEKASMDKFSIFPWWNMTKQVSRFLKRCEEGGNPEWLYILGLYEYFSMSKTDHGLNYLKRAADKGHVESSYVYSIILVCSGGELKQHGLKLLASLKRFRTREFRIKIRENFRWIRRFQFQGLRLFKKLERRKMGRRRRCCSLLRLLLLSSRSHVLLRIDLESLFVQTVVDY
ncbi:hypothetical protein Pint_23663 [Pistacia integerrima]|uniref:Uncharacterized protein n=1 Tax=Pistacia integerrima TaxID=434235 RepID=A0ACC0YHM9_9ROSI|nr:hypothetical protein Pint_23663 [Pistacia integerrima]